MSTTEWLAVGAAFASAIAALVGAIITARWGSEYGRAKDALIEMLRVSQEQLLSQKDTQIETLRMELEQLRAFSSPKIRESFVSMREQLEEYINQLTAEKERLEEDIKRRSQEVNSLTITNELHVSETEKLRGELDSLRNDKLTIQNELEEIRKAYLQEIHKPSELISLSDRQLKVIQFIMQFTDQNGYTPTIREIGDGVGISSTSVVNYNLTKLEEIGLISRSRDVTRGISLNMAKLDTLGIDTGVKPDSEGK